MKRSEDNGQTGWTLTNHCGEQKRVNNNLEVFLCEPTLLTSQDAMCSGGSIRSNGKAGSFGGHDSGG